ncbi:hypothetical protein K493DRAFT_310870, partial [Basidiobolus meristosporus CBS 931.73]
MTVTILINTLTECWISIILFVHSILHAFFGSSTAGRFYKCVDYLFLLGKHNTHKVRRQHRHSVTTSLTNPAEPTGREVNFLITLVWIPHQALICFTSLFALHFIYQEFLRACRFLLQVSQLLREMASRPAKISRSLEVSTEVKSAPLDEPTPGLTHNPSTTYSAEPKYTSSRKPGLFSRISGKSLRMKKFWGRLSLRSKSRR